MRDRLFTAFLALVLGAGTWAGLAFPGLATAPAPVSEEPFRMKWTVSDSLTPEGRLRPLKGKIGVYPGERFFVQVTPLGHHGRLACAFTLSDRQGKTLALWEGESATADTELARGSKTGNRLEFQVADLTASSSAFLRVELRDLDSGEKLERTEVFSVHKPIPEELREKVWRESRW